MKIIAVLLMVATLALSGCAMTGQRYYDRDFGDFEQDDITADIIQGRPGPGERPMPYPPYYRHPKE
jgi:hypothetical protein